MVRLEQEVTAVDAAVKALAKAKAANDPSAWQTARARLGPALATAHNQLERARTHAAEATADVEQRLDSTEKQLQALDRAAKNIGEAPLGWSPISREAAIIAIVAAPLDGGAHEGWARKMTALKAELAELSVPESRALATRLRKRHSNDPIAMALAPGVKITRSRYEEVLAFLDGARRREAIIATRSPIGRDADRASTSPGPQAADTVIADSMVALGIPAKNSCERARSTPDDAEAIVPHTHELMQTTAETLLPAFRASVDALDAPAALQLAQACVQGVAAVAAGRDRANAQARDADPSARARCQQGHAIESTPAPPVEIAVELEAHAQLAQRATELERAVRAFFGRVARDVSPQVFRGIVVGNGVQTPPGAATSPLETVLRESSTTVDLVIS